MLIILTLRRLKPEGAESQDTLGCIERHHLKGKKRKGARKGRSKGGMKEKGEREGEKEGTMISHSK